MTGSETPLEIVRSDRVGLAKKGGWDGATAFLGCNDYGDLWLSNTGRLGYSKTKWYNKDWDASIADITDVREVSVGTGLRYGLGPIASRQLQFSVGSDTYIVYFTGIVAFKSTWENLVSHVPGVHHAGVFLIDAKKTWENRGSRARAEEARRFWWNTLRGQLDSLPAAVAASIR